MALIAYIGRDADRGQWSFDTVHEQLAAIEIIKDLHSAFNHLDKPYAVLANLHNPSADLVTITERGLGVIELKHYYGQIWIDQLGEADESWHAGTKSKAVKSVPIRSANYLTPRKQVQTYTEAVREHVLSLLLPDELRGNPDEFRFQNTVCFSHPDVKINDVQTAVSRTYHRGANGLYAWEDFTITVPAGLPGWVSALRFDEHNKGAKRRPPFRLKLEQIHELATGQLNAILWTEIKNIMPTGEPYGYLVLAREGRRVQIFSLRRRKVLIGRGETCDISIPEEFDTVSRIHARITRRLTGEIMIDDGDGSRASKNGTYVNQRRISRATQLKSGQRISLGGMDEDDSSVCLLEFSVKKPVVPDTYTRV